jgi:hypothetical protein
MEILLLAIEFHDHVSLLARIDPGFENIEGQVVSPGKIAHDRFP